MTTPRERAIAVSKRLGLGNVAWTFIEDAIEQAVKAEREACAVVAESHAGGELDPAKIDTANNIAEAIRERSNAAAQG